jgi:hypothetical protein
MCASLSRRLPDGPLLPARRAPAIPPGEGIPA